MHKLIDILNLACALSLSLAEPPAERVAFQLQLPLCLAGIMAVAAATDVIPVAAVHPIVGGGGDDGGLACAPPLRAAAGS